MAQKRLVRRSFDSGGENAVSGSARCGSLPFGCSFWGLARVRSRRPTCPKSPSPNPRPSRPSQGGQTDRPATRAGRRDRSAGRAGEAANRGGHAWRAGPPLAAAQQLAAKTTALDQTRGNILPRIGANAYDLGQATVAALPQGDDAPIEKVLLQTPGFLQIRRRAAPCICAMNTPTFNIASTASFCPMASRASVRFSTAA